MRASRLPAPIALSICLAAAIPAAAAESDSVRLDYDLEGLLEGRDSASAGGTVLAALNTESAEAAQRDPPSPGQPAAEPDIDTIFRQVFGRDRPPLSRDEYVVVLNGINAGSHMVDPGEDGAGGGTVEAAMVRDFLIPLTIAELHPQLEALTAEAEQVRFADLRALGIEIAFDRRNLALVIDVPNDIRSVQQINVRVLANRRDVLLVDQADLSAYVSVRAGLDIVEDAARAPSGSERFAADIDAAINLYGVVAEAEFRYDDLRERAFSRDDIRLSYDDRRSLMRYEIGDLSIGKRPFQASPRIGGVAAFRKFSIDPYLNIRPVPSQSFELDSEARVEIVLNGQVLRTIDLRPGRYRLQDFPLIPSAANDIELRITYASGEVEVLLFPAFYDFELLENGLADYGLNIGVPYRDRDGRRIYDDGNYNVLGYFRYGVSDTLTLGANWEGDEHFDTVGGETIWASPLGTWALNFATDLRDPGFDSGQATLQYRWRDADRERDRAIDGSIQLTGRDFRTLSQLFSENFVKMQARARVGQAVGPDTRAQVSAGYARYRGLEGDSYFLGVNATHALGRVQLSGGVEYRQDGDDRGLVFQASLAIPFAGGSLFSNYRSEDNNVRVQYNRFEPYGLGSINASMAAERRDGRDRAFARLGYVANRFEANVQQIATNYFSDSDARDLRTELRAGSALVFADGHVALSRPVTNSFAVFRSAAGGDFDLAVDPQTGFGAVDTRYVARSGALGPAVVNNITPYFNRTIRVDAPEAPAGTSLGGQVYTLNSSYRGGFYIPVGTEANAAVVGNLVDRDGDPVAFITGTVAPAEGIEAEGQAEREEVLFFTNRAGRFYIEGLVGGRSYLLLPGEHPGTSVTISIPEDFVGLLQLSEPLVLPVDVPAPEGGTQP